MVLRRTGRDLALHPIVPGMMPGKESCVENILRGKSGSKFVSPVTLLVPCPTPAMDFQLKFNRQDHQRYPVQSAAS
jgi:hypothetical protein